MTYKELMFESLNQMTAGSEELYCPIYGILNEANLQHYAFFGFTQTHLLIAIVSGKTIIDTMRIALDIKSVKIKRTAVFREYVIDIVFESGWSCNITAAPKIMMIDTQKQNIHKFLDYLKSKAQKVNSKELKDYEGKKIRWQYFNTFIYMLFFFCSSIPPMLSVVTLKDSGFDFAAAIETFFECFMYLFVLFGILSPFIILSVLNRFLFGEIVAVANFDGLILQNRQLTWKSIKRVVYNPDFPSKHKTTYTYATLHIDEGEGEYTVDVLHFPIYGIRQIKKYNPSVKIQLSKGAKNMFLILIVGLLAAAIVVPFLK